MAYTNTPGTVSSPAKGGAYENVFTVNEASYQQVAAESVANSALSTAAAAASEAAAEAALFELNTRYIGSYATNPTVDANGNPLVEGTLYFNSTNDRMMVYTSSTWVPAAEGDVVGPAGSTDNAIVRYNTETGKLIQNSVVTISDAGTESNVEAMQFQVSPVNIPTIPGSLYWDSTDGAQTLSLVMAGGTATMQIGEETYIRIKASSAITNGQAVMFSGTVGASGVIAGAPASGLTSYTASYVIGIATQDIPLNGFGYVTRFGLVRGINTTGGAEAWVDGQILYFNPAVAGGLTKTVPTAPNAKVQICAVVTAATNGSLFVRPAFGGELGQYEGNVNIASLIDNNLLQYNSATARWENVVGPVGAVVGTTDTQTLTNKSLTSPTMTGVPVAPTAAVNNSTTQLATTAFVNAEISNDAVLKTGATGSARLPSGTTAQRDVAPTFGMQRANSTNTAMEWWNGTAWTGLGGASGAGGNPFVYENDITVTADYTIATGKNGMSAGPITVANGVTITVPSGSTWSIV